MQHLTFTHKLITLAFLVLILGITQDANARRANPDNLKYINNDAIKAKLWERPEWLSLLHYRKNSFTNSYYSEIDGKLFFNAKNGNQRPKAELFATIKAMHKTSIRKTKYHPQCMFPARLSWLQKNLPSINDGLPRVKCNKFLRWRHFLNAESLSLVFVSPSVDGSDSIFGNSFLKINPPKLRKNVYNKNKNLLPAKALSFAVSPTAKQKDDWFYSLNAAFGKYQGKLKVETYVKRIARYENSENRDLWEYKLNLTPFETELLLSHAWELMHTKIKYYFLDENSAYMLISLIDTVKPELKLPKAFSSQVLPVDTVRLLVEKELVANIKYIPSTLTNINYHYENYPSSRQKLISGLIDGSRKTTDPEFKKLASTVQVFIIEIANQYLQLSYKRGDLDRLSYKVRSLQLRKARKKLNRSIELPNAPPPSDRPDQDHKTSRLAFGAGTNDLENFIEINWRPALHDLLDLNGTYNPGTQINYLDTAIRFDDEHGLVQIERVHFISLYSLLPRNSLSTPWSFKFKVGFDRDTVYEKSDNLYFNMNGGMGLTYQLGKPVHVYGLLEGTMVLSKHFDSNVSFAVGPNLGMLWQINSSWKLWLDSSIQYYDKQNDDNIILKHSLGQSYALSKNKSLRLLLTQQGIEKQTNNEASLNLTWYY